MIALCVGHSREINWRPEGGAFSVGGESEHAYWSSLAPIIAQALLPVDSCIVMRYEGIGYGGATRWLAGRLREVGATAAIELHFNSFGDERKEGHEWLCWYASARGIDLAQSMRESYGAAFPTMKDRGIKLRFPADRGAEFLRLTHCPAVIAEPFFGSNYSDFAFAHENRERIAVAMAAGIRAWCGR
jgi:hypothetical protein